MQDWKYPQSDASGFNRNNLLKARQLLLKAGYRYQQGKLVNAAGQPVQIEFLLHQAEQQRDLMPYLRHLKRLGIQASIRMVETAQYYERLRNYQFDMIVDTMPQSLTPGRSRNSSGAVRLPRSQVIIIMPAFEIRPLMLSFSR